MKEAVVMLKSVTQMKNGVTLLDNFNLRIYKGEIMGLVCPNTHGMESLIELLCCNVPIHYGRIYFNEILVNNYEYSSMTTNRVSIIEKRSRLIETLTVSDNVFVLRKGFKKYRITPKLLNMQLEQFTKEAEIDIKGSEHVSDLTIFEKFVVELLKAVISGSKLIVIRDISNVLSAADLFEFQNLIKYYCAKGFSFLYICNHHEESFKICTRISLMKDGKILKVLDKKEFLDEIIYAYIPECRNIKVTQSYITGEEGILKFLNVNTDHLKNMNFTVEKGECIVILDMNNTSLKEILKIMSGEMKLLSGSIYFNGTHFTPKKAKRAIVNGIDFINENPAKSMLFMEMDYIQNLCFLMNEKNIHINKGIVKSVVQEYGSVLGSDIYETDITNCKPYSLYNLVYYRVHIHNPKIVFVMQPFSGADLYLRSHIIELINQLKKRGITVVILAVSIADSLLVADRLIMIEQGRLHSEYRSAEFYNLSSEGSTFEKLLDK